MAISNKALNDKIRAEYLGKIKNFFSGIGEEVLVTGSGEICMPCVDSEGNEKWVQLVVKVPTGSRLDGEPFDGYAMAEDYQMKVEEKAAKAQEAAKKKEAKIKKDAAARAAKAAAREKAKAEKEAREAGE